MTTNTKPKAIVHLLFRREGADWARFPEKGGLEPILLRTPATQWANQRIEIAVVCLQHDSTLLSRSDVSISAWRFDEDGLVDDHGSTAEKLFKLLPRPTAPGCGQVTQIADSDLLAIRALIPRPIPGNCSNDPSA